MSDKDKTTPRQIILNLTGLTPETKDENFFISIKKDYNGNFVLFYKKKFHRDTSTIANHLATVMMKQYNKSIIHIFDTYHQILVKEVIWDKDSIPKHKEEQELDNNLD